MPPEMNGAKPARTLASLRFAKESLETLNGDEFLEPNESEKVTQLVDVIGDLEERVDERRAELGG